MKLTQIDLAEGRGGSQREMPASEAVARAEEACGGTLLLFDPDSVPRAAVAICPGGGFGKVNTEHEGVAFAEWFVAHGIAAGVVKYRLPEGDPALPQQDVERAAELLRNRFDGVKTGVLGASIGGYLAACAALAQPAARRPDFQLLFYPVVSMEEEFAHRPSMLRMFGRELHGSQTPFPALPDRSGGASGLSRRGGRRRRRDAARRVPLCRMPAGGWRGRRVASLSLRRPRIRPATGVRVARSACRGVEDVARCDDRDGVISPFPKKILSLRPKPYRYGRE